MNFPPHRISRVEENALAGQGRWFVRGGLHSFEVASAKKWFAICGDMKELRNDVVQHQRQCVWVCVLLRVRLWYRGLMAAGGTCNLSARNWSHSVCVCVFLRMPCVRPSFYLFLDVSPVSLHDSTSSIRSTVDFGACVCVMQVRSSAHQWVWHYFDSVVSPTASHSIWKWVSGLFSQALPAYLWQSDVTVSLLR